MAARRGSTGESSMAAGGLAGSAAAAALRRVRSLAEAAPPGRLFAAIATLSEMSRRAEASFANAGEALDRGENVAAGRALERGISQLEHLAETAGREEELSPNYLRRRR